MMLLRTRRIWPRLVVLLAISYLASGCHRSTAEPTPQDTSPRDASVAVISPQRRSLEITVEQPGSIYPYEETYLFARVAGYVKQVHADIGQRVHAGQVLAEIDVPDLLAEANHKRALLRQTEAEAEQARKAVAAAEANIVVAEGAVLQARATLQRWQTEHRRVTRLVQSGSLDAQTRDEVNNQLQAAEAQLLASEAAVRKAKADHQKAQADLATALARVAVAQAEVRRLETLLGFAAIQAPFDGIVTRRQVNTGDFVQPNQNANRWLFSVARLDPVRVAIYVPETEAALVREKTPVVLWIKAAQNEPIHATVSRISWSLEPGPRTLRAEVDLPNPDGRFRPGMYVSAQLRPRTPEVLTLPRSALILRGRETACFLVQSQRAVRVAVRTGRSDGQYVEVLQWQPPGGDDKWVNFTGQELVAASTTGLSDGQPVQLASAR
jgi:HlyD family secretion protein